MYVYRYILYILYVYIYILYFMFSVLYLRYRYLWYMHVYIYMQYYILISCKFLGQISRVPIAIAWLRPARPPCRWAPKPSRRWRILRPMRFDGAVFSHGKAVGPWWVGHFSHGWWWWWWWGWVFFPPFKFGSPKPPASVWPGCSQGCVARCTVIHGLSHWAVELLRHKKGCCQRHVAYLGWFLGDAFGR